MSMFFMSLAFHRDSRFEGLVQIGFFIIPLFDLVPGLSLPGLSVDMWLGLS